MNFIHLSDLHFCSKHLRWVSKAMDAVLSDVVENPPDVIVISGDSFDHSMPMSAPAVSALYRYVANLAALCPTAVLNGTLLHDPMGCLDPLKELASEDRLVVIDEPGVWALDQSSSWSPLESPGDIADTDQVVLAGLPSLNKADPRVVEHGAHGFVNGVMLDFSQYADEAHNRSLPFVLTTHGTVMGSVTESDYALVSNDHEFTEEILFSCGADAIMLGHIHAHQIMQSPDGRQLMAYAGSLAVLIYGDHGDHGYARWNVQAGNASIEFVSIPGRRLLEVEFPGLPDMEELEARAAEAGPDCSVRIIWHVDQEYAGSVDRAAIKALFQDAERVDLVPKVFAIQSVRSEEIGQAVDTDGRVKAWLKSTGDDDRYEAVSMRLTMVQTMNLDTILAYTETLAVEIKK